MKIIVRQLIFKRRNIGWEILINNQGLKGRCEGNVKISIGGYF